MEHRVGTLVWVPRSDDSLWVPGSVVASRDGKVTVEISVDGQGTTSQRSKQIGLPRKRKLSHDSLSSSGSESDSDEESAAGPIGKCVTVPAEGLVSAHESALKGVNDLLTLAQLTPQALLHTLRVRYKRDEIYTSIGPILVVVNPYKKLPGLYDVDQVLSFVAKSGVGERFPPHIFAVAARAYGNLIKDGRNQAVLISGESGAGKTEATKQILRFLATASAGREQLEREVQFRPILESFLSNAEKQILDSNPVLEAFGNARTVRNANSSRFGKFIEVRFDNNARIVGASITSYLLEKSRVVSQSEGERSFHVFYYLLAGANREERKRYDLREAHTYHFLSANKNADEDVAASADEDARRFTDLKRAMLTVGVDEEEQRRIFSLLAAILALGNVTFRSESRDGSESAKVVDKRHVQVAARLLSCSADLLQLGLTTRRIARPGQYSSFYIKHLDIAQAESARDALAKALYTALFTHLISLVNSNMSAPGLRFIGVLDIFGFESFKTNRFEQLLINFANEQLHAFFNTTLFAVEQEEYRIEKIDVKEVSFVDNAGCLSLFRDRNNGLFPLLDEECILPKGSERNFIEKFVDVHRKNKFFVRQRHSRSTFGIRHYAGEVVYQSENMLAKNRDQLSPDLDTLSNSDDAWVRSVWSIVAPESEDQHVHRKRGKGKATLAKTFQKQLNELMKLLESVTPHFVRCIKPNEKQKPDLFDAAVIDRQLHYTGLLETVKSRQAGYPIRLPFIEFYNRFRILFAPPSETRRLPVIPPPVQTGSLITRELRENVERICALVGDGFMIGTSKVFLKDDLYAKIVGRSTMALSPWVVTLQRVYRGHVARKESVQLRADRDRLKYALLYLVIKRRARAALAEKRKREEEERQRREEEERREIEKRRKAEAARRQAMKERLAREKAEEEERKRKEEEENQKRKEVERLRDEEKRKRQEEERLAAEKEKEALAAKRKAEEKKAKEKASNLLVPATMAAGAAAGAALREGNERDFALDVLLGAESPMPPPPLYEDVFAAAPPAYADVVSGEGMGRMTLARKKTLANMLTLSRFNNASPARVAPLLNSLSPPPRPPPIPDVGRSGTIHRRIYSSPSSPRIDPTATTTSRVSESVPATLTRHGGLAMATQFGGTLGRSFGRQRSSLMTAHAGIEGFGTLRGMETLGIDFERERKPIQVKVDKEDDMQYLNQHLRDNHIENRDLDQAILDAYGSKILKEAAQVEEEVVGHRNRLSALGMLGLGHARSASMDAKLAEHRVRLEERRAFAEKKRYEIGRRRRLQRSAKIVRLAMRDIPPLKNDRPFRVKMYTVYSNPLSDFFWYLIVMLHCCLVFGEPTSHRESDQADVDSTTKRILQSIEVFICAFYVLDTMVAWAIFGTKRFLKSKATAITGIVIIAMWVDVILSLCGVNTGRFSRPLRMMLLVTRSRNLRSVVSSIIATVPAIAGVWISLIGLILIYCMMGVLMFCNTYSEDSEWTDGDHDTFNNFGSGLLSLFVLLTTENYPKVMLPPLRKNPLNAFFFVSFVGIGIYVFFSVIVAVVFDTYKKQRRQKVIEDRIRERESLSVAFKLLCMSDPLLAVDGTSVEVIDHDTFIELLSLVLPRSKRNVEQAEMYFSYIDQQNTGRLDILDFFEVCDTLLLRFKRVDDFSRLKSLKGVRSLLRKRPSGIKRVFKRMIRQKIGKGGTPQNNEKNYKELDDEGDAESLRKQPAKRKSQSLARRVGFEDEEKGEEHSEQEDEDDEEDEEEESDSESDSEEDADDIEDGEKRKSGADGQDPTKWKGRSGKRRPFQRYVLNPFVGMVLFVNLALLASISDESSLSLQWAVFIVDLFCLVLLCAEFIVRSVSYAPNWLNLLSPWSLFNQSLLIFECVVFVLILIFSEGVPFQISGMPPLVRLLHALSALRFLRVISIVPMIREVIETILSIVPLFSSVAVVLCAVFYLYAVVGMEIFSTVFIPPDAATSFDSFSGSMLTLFQVLTEENWSSVMYHGMDAVNDWVSIYFVSFFIVVVVIFLNLLIALIIETFQFQREKQQQEKQDLLLDRGKGMGRFRVKRGMKNWERAWVDDAKQGDGVGALNAGLGEKVDLLGLLKRKGGGRTPAGGFGHLAKYLQRSAGAAGAAAGLRFSIHGEGGGDGDRTESVESSVAESGEESVSSEDSVPEVILSEDGRFGDEDASFDEDRTRDNSDSSGDESSVASASDASGGGSGSGGS